MHYNSYIQFDGFWKKSIKNMKIIIYVIFIFILLGCGGNDSPSTKNPKINDINPSITKKTSTKKIFDSTIAPITMSNWYKPDINTSWQWQLKGDINTKYDVQIYDIDLFDSNASLIKSLQDDGKKVICYFSAGSFEDWRNDKDDFPSLALGNIMDGWENEKWLDISNEGLASIMKARLDLAIKKGCDGVEPDNMDGYTNNTGFNLTAKEQLAYNKFIANEARKRGLSVGLKNDLEQIIELEPYYDFSVNEQCHEYNECDKMKPFINANKPVLNVEYEGKYINNYNARTKLCNDTINLKFQTLILPLDLDDSFRYDCK